MDLRLGTPLWVTILVAAIALLGGHFLTVYREGNKAKQEKEKSWRAACQGLIKEIVDDATKHYCDATSLGSATDRSAAMINSNLKRLSNLSREMSALDPNDGAELGRHLRSLRDVITSPPDYQDPSRALRRASDPLFEDISACEGSLLRNLRKPRK